MDCSMLDEREKIMTIFNSLVSNGGAIEVRMEGESALFASRVIGIESAELIGGDRVGRDLPG